MNFKELPEDVSEFFVHLDMTKNMLAYFYQFYFKTNKPILRTLYANTLKNTQHKYGKRFENEVFNERSSFFQENFAHEFVKELAICLDALSDKMRENFSDKKSSVLPLKNPVKPKKPS